MSVVPAEDAPAATLFAGPGDLRARCRAFDWSATPLGPVDGWSQSLRSIASVVLGSAFPAIVLWGPDLVQIYNDGYVPFLGAKHPWGLGIPTRECWPEAWAFNEPIYERVLAGETVAFEDQLYPLLRNGPDAPPDDVYITLSYSPVRDETGDVGGVFITLFETTQQVRARALEADRDRLTHELAVERARLAEVFRQAPAFMAVLRPPAHTFELVNDAYFDLVGHRDILGKPVLEALPELRDQGFIELLDGVLATGEPFVGRELPVLLARTVGAEHEERFVDLVYLPITEADGTRSGLMAHGSDVTEQVNARREVERLLAESRQTQEALEDANAQLEEQQAELELSNQALQDNAVELEAQTLALDEALAELRTSERRFRDVFEQAPVAVAVLTGPTHVYSIVSPRYAAFGGGRQLVGLPFREAFHETADQGLLEIMDRVYDSGEPLYFTERRVLLDRDGDGEREEYFFNVGYQPLRDGAGTVYGLASTAYDVTEQVRARGELEAARAMAERARAEAEDANRAKSQFLTTMSHELRTPLNAIAGYADLLLLGVRGAMEESQRRDVERMQRSGRHLLSLINDILNFAKLEAGRVELRAERVPVAATLAGLDDLIAPQVTGKQLRLTLGACEPGLAVVADEEKVQQVLLNLLSNAVKFTDAGGEIALSCEARGDAVLIHVRDSGRGVPAEEIERIFDPFVQVDRQLTPASQQGVGLGLAISRDLARAMGGDLAATSTLGAGSTFTLSLPRAE